MIKLTVGDFLLNKLTAIENIYEHHIYVFRDETTVLYVGRSTDIEARLWEHFGPMPGYRGRFHQGPSIVGKVVESHYPDSLAWEIELLTVKDCRSQLPDIPADIEILFPLDYDHMIETSMILHLAPILNTSNNPRYDEGAKKYRLPNDAIIKAHIEIFDS